MSRPVDERYDGLGVAGWSVGWFILYICLVVDGDLAFNDNYFSSNWVCLYMSGPSMKDTPLCSGVKNN